MSIAPESAVGPLAQAPPDRETQNLEQWARQGIALLFGDRKLDMNEKRVLRAFMEEVAARSQASGGIGNGTAPSQPQAPGAGPAEMNQNTEPMHASAGDQPDEGDGSY